ncbi:unnamed protein product [Ceutorhynchus assimilis]|uniref:Leucine-rich repeat flightless-interacting protein 2 n=1 Tax=Ceutorhynchus assimilis TaxID=467358 RepID=A0A9N9MWE1_9CUCU|nr:unnamed protein product [Ceutorhynchus assimilis]
MSSSEPQSLNYSINEEMNNNVMKKGGASEDETLDIVDPHILLENWTDSNGDESDVIHNFMQASNDEAEARLWAKRQARAEAREIRMRELERMQREQEENADRQFDMLVASSDPAWGPRGRGTSATRHRPASRRNSEDSLEDSGSGGGSLRDLKAELKDVEERFRKAMIQNAQLDNDKTAHTYQLELLKDRLEELEEENSQLKREHRDKCREFDQLQRLCQQLKNDLGAYKFELEERDRIIEEKGLVIVYGDPEKEGDPPRKALIQAENARLLEGGDGSLDVRLANFAKEKGELQDQISSLKLELEEERSRRRKSGSGSLLNGPSSDYDPDDLQREASKQLADYKFRAQKAEQDVATLQATVARLESQVIRYKTAAEVSEQSEEALKLEKRKLQREDSNNSLTDISSIDDSVSEANSY